MSKQAKETVLDMIDRFMLPDAMGKKTTVIEKRVGIARGQDLYDDEYDFDEMNPEIAKMFEVTE